MNNLKRTADSALILVVDDDSAIRLLMRESLEQAGLIVIEAKNGSEAIYLFAEKSPELILLDVKMPKMDGYEVCEQIRRRADGKETPIIMVTGLEDDDSIERAYQVGATDFITKPVVWTILSHRVRYLLRAGKAFKALRLNEERLVQAQRVASMGNWDWDIINDRIHWSKELYRIFKQPLDTPEFSFHQSMSFVHPDEQQNVREVIDSALNNNKPYNIEFKIIRTDGTQLTVEQQAEVVCNSQGVPVRMYGTIQDVSSRKLAENRIRQLAYYDHLTGLPNRQMFYETMKRAMVSCQRDGTKLALIFLDLDRFKEVNDTLGHNAGDDLLKNIAQYLTKSIRASDVFTLAGVNDNSEASLSRLGGDEFTILLPYLKEVDVAAHVCNRVLDQLRLPMKIGGQNLTVTGSMGIAIYPDDGEDIDSLLKHSDMAMYHAKQSGKNNFQFFTSSMNEQVKLRMDTEKELQHALENNEFMLHYEPRIEISSGKITGVEALIRWNHPTRGILFPEHFIEIAEDCGLMNEIGKWVLRTTCDTLTSLSESNINPITMTVNLSNSQYKKIDFVQMVQQLLQTSGVNPEYLELELNETAIVEDMELALRTFKKLKDLGLMLSLDNFGTGHSSLYYLKQFPIDSLKIDQGFIADIATNQKDITIIKSIIILTQGLNLISVAEGVESSDQMEILRKLGCQQIQGQLVSKPLSLLQVKQLLKADN